jgi:hypothetical protein
MRRHDLDKVVGGCGWEDFERFVAASAFSLEMFVEVCMASDILIYTLVFSSIGPNPPESCVRKQ